MLARMVDHSAEIPGLSEAPSPAALHDTSQVFQALAEGFRLVLAEA
jgi:hypothetical protein